MQHVQTRSTTSALVLTAVLIALATLFTMYTKIPVPGIRGYFNVGDVVIMTSALLLGRKYGAYIGAIGPALADLFLGYVVFVPITFVVKGLEGYLVGTVYNNKTTTSALVSNYRRRYCYRSRLLYRRILCIRPRRSDCKYFN